MRSLDDKKYNIDGHLGFSEVDVNMCAFSDNAF
jgi:hypothetical protein